MSLDRQEIVNKIYDDLGLDIRDEVVDRSILFYKKIYDSAYDFYTSPFQDSSGSNTRRPIVIQQKKKYNAEDILDILLELLAEQSSKGSGGTSWWNKYKREMSRSRIEKAIENRHLKHLDKRLYSKTNQDLITQRGLIEKHQSILGEKYDKEKKVIEESLASGDDFDKPVAERFIFLHNKNKTTPNNKKP
ncbi:MAG: hypothetical protein HOI53_04555 [Francisellaceae bacterium]|jgi:hypothetical protein|nr:hypothetical protein [Francisellaceae bacterium]MBT6207275.1 hypothetical protein [Francisellaceae bacterium]MBT6539640.1 hypothetical protein [Francisellaceae bacterium]